MALDGIDWLTNCPNFCPIASSVTGRLPKLIELRRVALAHHLPPHTPIGVGRNTVQTALPELLKHLSAVCQDADNEDRNDVGKP